MNFILSWFACSLPSFIIEPRSQKRDKDGRYTEQIRSRTGSRLAPHPRNRNGAQLRGREMRGWDNRKYLSNKG